MKRINDITGSCIESITQNTKQSSHEQNAEKFKESAEIVNRLFIALKGIFTAWGASFHNADDINTAKQQWTLALIEGHITSEEQIAAGLKEARKCPIRYWPSSGMFISWCEPNLHIHRNKPDYGVTPTKEISNERRKEIIKKYQQYLNATPLLIRSSKIPIEPDEQD